MEKNCTANSRSIQSNQDDVHQGLDEIIKKHLMTAYQKPIAIHTLLAFDEMVEKLERLGVSSVLLDSGCGAGDSTIYLAQQHPESTIIGIDKSFVRLQKSKRKDVPENVLFVQADQFDFWRLAAKSNWHIKKHFIFYPNPWPKKAHIRRRVHGHPAFIDLVQITTEIEVRSNWLVYLQEFSRAWKRIAGGSCDVSEIGKTAPISLFEKKFIESGHILYRLTSHKE